MEEIKVLVSGQLVRVDLGASHSEDAAVSAEGSAEEDEISSQDDAMLLAVDVSHPSEAESTAAERPGSPSPLSQPSTGTGGGANAESISVWESISKKRHNILSSTAAREIYYYVNNP